MMDLRKLAALDVAFLGYGVILAEYVFAVVFSPALGIFVLVRSHSQWQNLLGWYFVSLGINYVPMLWWTISIGSRERARAEAAGAILDRPGSMAKFRRVSLVLLVPLLPVAMIALRRLRLGRKTGQNLPGN